MVTFDDLLVAEANKDITTIVFADETAQTRLGKIFQIVDHVENGGQKLVVLQYFDQTHTLQSYGILVPDHLDRVYAIINEQERQEKDRALSQVTPS